MASSRLKRKVEVGDQGEFGNLTENFVSVGTPLPALTENKKDKNEFKPVWQQEVYDDQGRRRLHGAFTGGFSAGYYNTVGSKEGWAPSTFKSSRSERASNVKPSVADAAKQFMDEEDLAELAASRTLETNQAYNSTSRPVAATPIADYDPLLGHFGSSTPATPSLNATSTPAPDDILSSLVQPSSARIGLKLMRQMGWRDGQGVGPRISYARRKEQAIEIGVKLSEEDQDGGEEAEKHLYAPLDRPLHLVQGNSASTEKGWGLGYQPGLTLNAQLGGKQGMDKGASTSSGAYRVDEDPYGEDEGGRSSEGRGFYTGMNDLGDDGDDDYRIATSGKKTMVNKASIRSSSTQAFHDGTPVLPEFRLVTEGSNVASTSRLPPTPPTGWQPNPSRLWKDPRSSDSSQDANGKGKGKQLDADERGALLGEKLPEPIPKSVFDYLSAKSRERLASLTDTSKPSSTIPPDSIATSTPASAEPDAQLFVPSLDRPTALAALKGFQPYSAASTSPDPVKQARYTLYLQYQASDDSSTTTSPFGPRKLPNGKLQTVQELNRELSEYSQSARVFKPVSGMLGNRFESSKTGSLDAPKVEPGLYQPPSRTQASASLPSSSDYYTSTIGTSSSASEPPAPKLSPAQIAAREGNFGHLTRTTSQFRPTKLLCKRFGIRDPYENGGDGGTTDDAPGGAFGEATKTGWSTGEAHKTRQPIGESAMDQMMESAGFKRFQEASKVINEDEPEIAKGAFETPEGGDKTTKRAGAKPKQTIETVGMGDDETQGEEIVEEERAPPDIFAAIFADSEDEDDDADPEEEKEMQEEEEPSGRLDSLEIKRSPTTTTADPPPPAADAAGPNSTADVAVRSSEPSSQPLSLDSIASYKPSFVSTNSRTTTSVPDSTANPPKKKKKSKRKVALSFDLEGEEGDGPLGGESSKKKLKRVESSRANQERGSKASSRKVDMEDEWEEVSKVHPSIAESTTAPTKAISKDGRMKASDLY